MRSIALVLVAMMVLTACTVSSETGTSEEPVIELEKVTTPPAPEPDETTPPAPTGGGEPRADLPQVCELASAEEVSGLVGIEVTGGETISGGCVYEPADDSDIFFYLNTGAFPISNDECLVQLPAEPLFPEETVEPVSGYGLQASKVTSEDRSDLFVCIDGALITLEMLGLEDLSAQDHEGVARSILELMLGRL